MKMHARLLAGLAAATILVSSLSVAPRTAWADDGGQTIQAAPPIKSTDTTATKGDSGQAAPDTLSQEAAIARARKLMHIDPSLSKVSASFDQFGGNTPTWQIYFTLPADQQVPGERTPNVSVGMRATDGEILSYGYYGGDAVRNEAGTQLTREQAFEKAKAFLLNLNPKHFGSMVLNEHVTTSGYGGDLVYTFTYERHQFGRLVVGSGGGAEGITISVSGVDGMIRNYNENWTEGVQFPEQAPALDQQAALAAYRQQVGWELAYDQIQDPLATSSRYVLGYGPANQSIGRLDAVTGKLLAWDGSEVGDFVQAAPPAATPLPTMQLPLNKDDAEKRVRQLLGLPDQMQLQSASMNGDGDGQSWSFSFQQDLGEGRGSGAWASVRVKDGVVLSASHYEDRSAQSGQEPKFTATDLAPKAGAFITAAIGAEAANWRPIPDLSYPGWKDSGSIGFTYGLMHDGHRVQGYSLTVQVSTITGEVQSMWGASLPETDLKLPKADGIGTADAAFDAWAKAAGLELVYWIHPKESMRMKMAPTKVTEMVVTLAWQQPEWAQGFMAADTLRLTDSQGHDVLAMRGEPVDLTGPGSDALRILVSQQLFAPDSTGHIYPGKVVTRGEALQLLLTQRGFMPLRGEMAAQYAMAKADASSSYAGYIASAIANGILDQGTTEFKPDEPITREYFAALAARTLGYGAIARMDTQIPLDAPDADQISAARHNAVALLVGLKLLDLQDGKVAPAATMTRADIAVSMVRIMTLKR